MGPGFSRSASGQKLVAVGRPRRRQASSLQAARHAVELLERRTLLSGGLIAPTAVTADQDVKGDIELSFPVSASTTGVTGYEVQRSDNGGAYATLTTLQGATTSYTDVGPFAGGSTYTYQVVTEGTLSASTPTTSNTLLFIAAPTGGSTIDESSGFTNATPALTSQGTSGNGLSFAPTVSGSQLQLSDGATDEADSVFFTQPTPVNGDFNASFDFLFNYSALPARAADGLTFTIQGDSPTAIGGEGGDIGYEGIKPSLALYFDMYYMVSTTGIGVNGQLQSSMDMSGSLGNALINVDANDNTDLFQCSLTYDSSTHTLHEVLRDLGTGLGYTHDYDLSGFNLNGLFGSGSDDYVGFTDGAGSGTNVGLINDFKFTNENAAPSIGQPVTVTAAQNVNGTVSVTFPTPHTDGLPVTNYQVQQSINGGAYTTVGTVPFSATAAANTYADASAIPAGSKVTYQVAVVAPSGDSPATTSNTVLFESAGAAGTTISHPTGFASAGDFTLNGASVSGTQLELTDGNLSEANSAFETKPIAVNGDFNASFDFQFNVPSDETSGDGFIFTLQNQSNSAVGASGYNLGYAGTRPSVGIFLQNSYGETETGLVANGTFVSYNDMSNALGSAFAKVDDSGNTDVFRASLTYDSTAKSLHEVVVDLGTGLGFTYDYDLSSYKLTDLLGPGSSDYVGFTGATSSTVSSQFINDFRFTDPDSTAGLPQPYVLTAEQDVNGGISVSFPAPPSTTVTGFQVQKSVDGGAYATVTTIPYSASTKVYSYEDKTGLTGGSTITYEVASLQGADSSAPLASNPVLFETAGSSGASFSHPTGFASATDLTLNGAQIDNSQLELTDGNPSEANSAFETKAVAVDGDFNASFDFQLNTPSGDGFVFTIQGDSATAVGPDGTSFGFPAPPSVGVYFQSSYQETLTGLAINGSIQSGIDMSTSLGNAFAVLDGDANTDVFKVSLTYDSTAKLLHEVVLDLGTGLSFTNDYDMSSAKVLDLLGPGSQDYVGFTGGTATNTSIQFINDFAFTDGDATAHLAQPNNVTAVETVKGTVNLEFTAPAPSGITVSGYQVQESVNGGAYTTLATVPYSASSSIYSYTDPGTYASGTRLTYQVSTLSPSGNSGASASNTLYYITGTAIDESSGFTNAGSLLTAQTTGGTGTGFLPGPDGSQLQLSDGATSEADSVFFTKPVTVDGDFNASFDFQFNYSALPTRAADGLTFTIQSDAATAIGGEGGSLGYQGITPSLSLYFSMYYMVSHTGIGVNGSQEPSVDMSGSVGNALINVDQVEDTDVFQVSLSYDSTAKILHEVLVDTGTGYGFTQDYDLSSYDLSKVFGPGINDYIGFTDGAGSGTNTGLINDFSFATSTPAVTAPTVVGAVGVTDATTATTAQTQRSETRNLVVTFSEPVTLGSNPFSLQLLNTGGSGLNDGSAATDASAALGVPIAVAGSNNTVYSIPILASTTYSDTTGSLNDGIYTLTVNASAVTSSGVAMSANFVSPTFHRLYGDINGDGAVNPSDSRAFGKTFGSGTGDAAFNADFDFNADGAINPIDSRQFGKRFGLTFSDIDD